MKQNIDHNISLKKFQNKNILITIFLVSLLFKPLWLFNNQNLGQPADDMYHWLHAATLAFDFDLDYIEDYTIPNGTFNPKTNVPSSVPGAGYFASPFVFIFSIFDKLYFSDYHFQRVNPIGSFSYIGFFLSGVVYTYFGFYLLKKISTIRKQKYSGIIFFCGLVSTLVHYVTTRFLMPHAIEFFLCCSILYLFERRPSLPFSRKEFSLLIFLYFGLSITRPSTFLYSLVLLLYYKEKFNFSLSNLAYYLPTTLTFMGIYILLSQLLYGSNYMLLNTYGSDMDEYRATLNLDQFFDGMLKLPNLFFSLNMGVIFSAPIVFLGIYYLFSKYLMTHEKPIKKLFLLLYFGSSLLPLLIWQGRDVAYGQRLLVGLLPMSILLTSKFIENNKISKYFIVLLNSFTYVGYLFFYSSKNLTLRDGKTLWGTEVGFTAENYYLEVLKSFTDLEVLLSVISRNIYSVNIFKFLDYRILVENFSFINLLNNEKVKAFLEYLDIYSQIDVAYLLLVNLIIFSFSYFFVCLTKNH